MYLCIPISPSTSNDHYFSTPTPPPFCDDISTLDQNEFDAPAVPLTAPSTLLWDSLQTKYGSLKRFSSVLNLLQTQQLTDDIVVPNFINLFLSNCTTFSLSYSQASKLLRSPIIFSESVFSGFEGRDQDLITLLNDPSLLKYVICCLSKLEESDGGSQNLSLLFTDGLPASFLAHILNQKLNDPRYYIDPVAVYHSIFYGAVEKNRTGKKAMSKC